MYNYGLAQIFGVIGIAFSVLAMQMKKKKYIMIMLLCVNLASALNFLFLDSLSGSLICFFAALETFINYLFDSKNKKVPLYIILFYIIVNIFLGILTYKSLLDIIPILCALLYCATICMKKESNIRKIMLNNQLLWMYYDIKVKAYLFCLSNILSLISNLIAIYRFDLKKKKRSIKK